MTYIVVSNGRISPVRSIAKRYILCQKLHSHIHLVVPPKAWTFAKRSLGVEWGRFSRVVVVPVFAKTPLTPTILINRDFARYIYYAHVPVEVQKRRRNYVGQTRACSKSVNCSILRGVIINKVD